jgi:multidrug efflux pump subunit AcrA (membrane-fusion protein)
MHLHGGSKMSNKRMVWIVAGVILLLGILISSVLSNQKQPMRRRPAARPKTVEVVMVKNGDIPTEVVMTGPLTAYDKVELYAEVSGVCLYTETRFKEGVRYQKEDVLIQMDDRVYKNNVLAQKSSLLNQITLLLPDLSIDFPESARRWEVYLDGFDLGQPLAPLPDVSSDQERYYIASRNIYNLYYSVKSMEETLAKYTLRAPFDGVVTEANINPGTLIRVGQKLGEFTNTELLEMEAAVNVRDAERLRVGQVVTLKSDVVPGAFEGSIVRINPVIDRSTMTSRVYIHTRDSRLTDGMYLTARVEAAPIRDAIAVLKDLVSEGRLFTVVDSTLVSTPVSVVAEMGDRVVVRGLADGAQILGEAWVEAREGARLPGATQSPQGIDDGAPESSADGGGR